VRYRSVTHSPDRVMRVPHGVAHLRADGLDNGMADMGGRGRQLHLTVLERRVGARARKRGRPEAAPAFTLRNR